MGDLTDVVVIQPYVPTYRVAFFEEIARYLEARGRRLVVVAAEPGTAQAARGDNARPPWVTTVESRRLGWRGWSIDRGVPKRFWRGAGVVVVPLQATRLDLWRLVAFRRRSQRLVLWGHVRDYVTPGHPVDRWLETTAMKRADAVLAYTASGRDDAIARGVRPNRVVALENTIDTVGLEAACRAVTAEDVVVFRQQCGIGSDHYVVAYIGALDAPKRVDLLAASLDVLWESRRDIHLVVLGQGTDSPRLERARVRGQVSMLGYGDNRLKAVVSRTAVAIVSTGRVGLLAVDALVMKLPILQASYQYHAPEHDYLVEGASVLTVRDDPVAFADRISTWCVPDRVRPEDPVWPVPSLPAMVARFAGALMEGGRSDGAS